MQTTVLPTQQPGLELNLDFRRKQQTTTGKIESKVEEGMFKETAYYSPAGGFSVSFFSLFFSSFLYFPISFLSPSLM